VGLGDGLVPGDANDSLAACFEQRLALGVVGTGELVVVPRGAVGLDHESLLGPSEVGDHATPVEM
jgi:hypothetical protein